MGQAHTCGIWVAKPGREEDFIAAWHDAAQWTTREYPVGGGRLLQDKKDPRRFYSFGVWSSTDDIEAWRASSEFKERLAALEEIVDDFRIETLELRAEVGDPCAVV